MKFQRTILPELADDSQPPNGAMIQLYQYTPAPGDVVEVLNPYAYYMNFSDLVVTKSIENAVEKVAIGMAKATSDTLEAWGYNGD